MIVRNIFIGLILILSILLSTAYILHHGSNKSTLFQGKSIHGNLQVDVYNNMLCMNFNSGKESYDKLHQGCVYNNSLEIIFGSLKALMGSLFFVDSPERILIIGLGVGILPIAIKHILPESIVDVVEIDPTVVEVARAHFNWPINSNNLTTHIIDGRKFIKQAASKLLEYDIIILDAFNDTNVPEHLTTVEFLQEVKNILKSSGVLGANTSANSHSYDSESATYQIVFGNYINILRYQESSNRVILATKDKLPEPEIIFRNAKKYQKKFKDIFSIEVNDLIKNMQNSGDYDGKITIIRDKFI